MAIQVRVTQEPGVVREVSEQQYVDLARQGLIHSHNIEGTESPNPWEPLEYETEDEAGIEPAELDLVEGSEAAVEIGEDGVPVLSEFVEPAPIVEDAAPAVKKASTKKKEA